MCRCTPSEVNGHTSPAWQVRGVPLHDFRWLRAARHVVLSPSTFAWWAAYLGAAEAIHFPIAPAVVPMPWCRLIVPGDGRFVYHDFWARRLLWDAGEARARCDAISVMQAEKMNGTEAFLPYFSDGV